MATCPSIPAARFTFCLFLFVLFSLVVVVLSGEPTQNQGRGLIDRKLVISLLAVPRRLFCFGSLVILDVACCYLWLFSLYLSIKIGENSCEMLD